MARPQRLAGHGSRLDRGGSSSKWEPCRTWKQRLLSRFVGIVHAEGLGHPSSNVQVRHVDGVPARLRSQSFTAIDTGGVSHKTASRRWEAAHSTLRTLAVGGYKNALAML